MKDYYQILGLSPDCNLEEIKNTYREYAKHFHPDKHGGSAFFNNKFIEAKEAYETLSDAKSRRYHDDYHNYTNTNLNESESANGTYDNTEITVNHYINWAYQWGEEGNLEKAIDEIDTGISKFPNSGELYTLRGDILRNQGFPIAALSDYRTGFKLGSIDAKNSIIELESINENVLSRMRTILFNSMAFHLTTPFLFFSISFIDPVAAMFVSFGVSFVAQIIYINQKSKTSREEKAFLFKSISYQFIVLLALMGGIAFSIFSIYFLVDN